MRARCACFAKNIGFRPRLLQVGPMLVPSGTARGIVNPTALAAAPANGMLPVG